MVTSKNQHGNYKWNRSYCYEGVYKIKQFTQMLCKPSTASDNAMIHITYMLIFTCLNVTFKHITFNPEAKLMHFNCLTSYGSKWQRVEAWPFQSFSPNITKLPFTQT